MDGWEEGVFVPVSDSEEEHKTNHSPSDLSSDNCQQHRDNERPRHLTKRQRRHRRDLAASAAVESVTHISRLADLSIDEDLQSSQQMADLVADLPLEIGMIASRVVPSLSRLCSLAVARDQKTALMCGGKARFGWGSGCFRQSVPFAMKMTVNQAALEKSFNDNTHLWFQDCLTRGEIFASKWGHRFNRNKDSVTNRRKIIPNMMRWGFWRHHRNVSSYAHSDCYHGYTMQSLESSWFRTAAQFGSECWFEMTDNLTEDHAIWPEYFLKVLADFIIHLYQCAVNIPSRDSCTSPRRTDSASPVKSKNKKRNKTSSSTNKLRTSGGQEFVKEITRKQHLDKIHTRLTHQFPSLMRIFGDESMAYASWSLGLLGEAGSALLQLANRGYLNEPRRGITFLTELSRMWTSFGHHNISEIFIDLLMKRAAAIENVFFNRHLVPGTGRLLHTCNYDNGVMTSYQAERSFDRWMSYLEMNEEIRHPDSAYYAARSVVCIHASDGEFWSIRAVKKLNQMASYISQASGISLFLAFLFAMRGDQESTYQHLLISDLFCTAFNPEIRQHQLDALLFYTKQSEVRSPKVLWRRDLAAPIFPNLEDLFNTSNKGLFHNWANYVSQVGDLSSVPLDIHLTEDGYLSACVETKLPPMTTLLLDPMTGAMIGDCGMYRPKSRRPDMDCDTINVSSLEINFDRPHRTHLMTLPQDKSVVELHTFGLLMTDNTEEPYEPPNRLPTFSLHWCGVSTTKLNLSLSMREFLRDKLQSLGQLSSEIIDYAFVKKRALIHNILHGFSCMHSEFPVNSSKWRSWFRQVLPQYTFSLTKVHRLHRGLALCFLYRQLKGHKGASCPALRILMLVDLSSKESFQQPQIFDYSCDDLTSRAFRQMDNLSSLEDSDIFPRFVYSTADNLEIDIRSISRPGVETSRLQSVSSYAVLNKRVYALTSSGLLSIEVGSKEVRTLQQGEFFHLSRMGDILVVMVTKMSDRFIFIDTSRDDHPCLPISDCTDSVTIKEEGQGPELVIPDRETMAEETTPKGILETRMINFGEAVIGALPSNGMLLILRYENSCVKVILALKVPGLVMEVKFTDNCILVISGLAGRELQSPHVCQCLSVFSWSGQLTNFLPGLGPGPHDLFSIEMAPAGQNEEPSSTAADSLVVLRDGFGALTALRLSPVLSKMNNDPNIMQFF